MDWEMWGVIVNAGIMVLTAGGVFLTLSGLKRQIEQFHAAAAQTLIHDQYNLCRALDQAGTEHPELYYLLALPVSGKHTDDETWTTYDDLKAKAGRMLERESGNAATAAKLYLKERAVACHIFNIYEQTLLQRDLATEGRDKRREKILDDLVVYYETKMLRNPRLRHHWNAGGSDMMDPGTRKRYDAMLAKFASDVPDPHSPIEMPVAAH